MASRKTRRRNILQILALAVAVVVVVGVSIAFQSWWSDRSDPEPEDVSISVSASAGDLEVFPYSICEPGVECPENEVPVLNVGPDEELRLTIPEVIHNHDWYLLTIYDDPGANDEQYFRSYQATDVTVPGSVDPVEEGGQRPNLVVVEVTTVLIGHDDAGEESPYTVTWSLSTVEE